MVSTKKEKDKGLAKSNGQIPAYNLRWKFKLKTTQWVLYIEFSRVRGVSSGDKMNLLFTYPWIKTLTYSQERSHGPAQISLSPSHRGRKVSSGTDVMRGLLWWGSFSCGAWFIRKQLYLVQGEKKSGPVLPTSDLRTASATEECGLGGDQLELLAVHMRSWIR